MSRFYHDVLGNISDEMVDIIEEYLQEFYK